MPALSAYIYMKEYMETGMKDRKGEPLPAWKKGLLTAALGLLAVTLAAGVRSGRTGDGGRRELAAPAYGERASEGAVPAGEEAESPRSRTSGESRESKRIALTFDDDVIIGLSQEISYKEAVSMI